MSSSIFAESPVSTNESRMSDSNLVVVYGKNGVNNVDREGLENLIDDKGVSTISVVRLTSPTPSMKDEEEAENELKKNKKKDNEEKDDEEEKNDNDSEHSGKSTDSELGDSEQETGDESEKRKKKLQREKPETVGLIIEDFCLPEKTKEITKAALALSGLQPLTVSVNFEIQVKALKNDHCYTPLTSPSQLHDRKPEPKPLSPSAISAVTSVKAAQKMAAIKAKNAANRAAAASEKSNEDDSINKKSIDESEDNETAEDENESEYSESEDSGDTDNDRDSDLDFDVNDRTGRRRKSNKKFSKRKLKNKILKKRQSINNEFNSSQEDEKKLKTVRGGIDKSCVAQTIPQSTVSSSGNNTFKPTLAKCNPVQSSAKLLITSPKIEIRSQNRFPSSNISQTILKSPQTQIVQKNSRSDVLSNIITGTGKPSGDPSGKPVVQNVVIIKPPNKKPLNNAQGGFTDITKYLSKTENIRASNVQVCELIKPDNSGSIILRRNEQEVKYPQVINATLISSPNRMTKKGFMPLIPDKTKSQLLPAQISVQIQQKAEESSQKDVDNQDEEMDIIDSLVGQIQNSEQTTSTKIDNAPKITKTYEGLNTASQNIFANQQSSQKKAVIIHSNTSHSAFTTGTNQVDAVDISNAPLLEAPDEIPEDLIKDMAELIDHKTLQELVEEQQQLQSQRSTQSINVTDFETSIPKNFLMLPVSQSVQNESQSNNILIKSQNEENIIKVDQTLHQSDFESNDNNHNTKESQITTNQQPVQVISRSGRVITLPPIEAPTTRAKRRAAAGISATDTPTPPMSSNVSEASESDFPVTPKTAAYIIKQQQKGSNSRRNSKDQLKKPTIESVKKQKRNSTTTQLFTEENIQSQDESSQGEDEDDPNKLWCICRQPHNNRFMICCDSCEDWFHGTCVGVTKSMGKEMEINKTEWTCPNCKDGKKQQTIKMMFEKQPVVLTTSSNKTIIKPVIQDKKEKTKNSTKKINKQKSADVSLISSVSTPLSKSMQQKISEIIGVPLPDHIVSYPVVENVEVQLTNTAVQKKKPVINKATKIPTISKEISEKIVPTTIKKKGSPKPKDFEPEPIKSNEQYEKEIEQKPVEVEIILCIVCKKDQVRQNSIYCSDDCIRKHAHNALVVKATKLQIASGSSSTALCTEGLEKKKKQPSSFEEALANASLPTPKKIERVCVFERKTGKILTGNNAPTTTNLKRWLQENPTFEVVLPGSPQAHAIERNKLKQKSQTVVITPEAQQRSIQSYRQQSARPQPQQKNVIKIIKSISSNPSPKSDSQLHEINEVIHKPVAQKALTFHHTSPSKGEKSEIKNENRSESVENKLEKGDKLKSDKTEKNEKSEKQNRLEKSPSKAPIKKQLSKEKEKEKESDKDRSQSSEPIRLNVKRTLKEKLITRLAEITEENHPKLSETECETYANETEEEMFELFKDTGVKYKAKYRSLAFNIKDHKNKTLFRKICEKIIEPKQLVRMTPEELASQELAQWRENENKHQLEMIKKSELDLLSCAKNYVLKTHKGEEVIEDKLTDRVNLDITIPVEDVVTVLNNSTVSSTSEIEKITPSRDCFKSTLQVQENDADSSLGSSVLKAEGMVLDFNQVSGEMEEDKKKENKKERDRRYRSKDRHRDKSSRKSRSRSRSRDRKRHKTPQRDEDNRPHQHKSHGKDKRSQSLEQELPDLKNKREISENHVEVDKVNFGHSIQHDQEEELHGFSEHEPKYKYDLSSTNDDKKKKDKAGHSEDFEHSKEMEENTNQDHTNNKTGKKEGKSHHHSHHHHEDDRNARHDNKRRSYTHSPSVEDEDERRKRRHHPHNSQGNQHHRSSSLISGSSPSIDSEESRKDSTSKTKTDSKSSTPTSTTVSEISGSIKKVSSITINKQTSSSKHHKNKSINQKSKTTDISEYSLIDKIFAESERTIEEAANLIPVASGKEKSLVKPADSQSSLTKSSPENVDSPNETKELKKIDSSGNDSEQELPSSTVTIPTPPEDPYKYYASDLSTIVWTGNINMIDVATFNIIIQPISGNFTNIEKEFPTELDVVGRIGPDTVWDYIGKIKKSPNKEIVLVRLIPSPESETNAYTALYLYLEKRKRLGVVKSTSPTIKDFYVLPLHSKTELPAILTAPSSESFDDDSRPDLLIGIIIRIMDFGQSKRYITAPASTSSILSDAVTKIVRKSMPSTIPSSSGLRGETTVIQNKKKLDLGDSTDLGEEEDYKPESPHMNITGTKVFSILTGKSVDNARETKVLKEQEQNSDNEMYDADDADEPYSPGGSSDEEITTITTAKAENSSTNISNNAIMPVTADELQRKVEELTRQIEKEKKEIENLGNVTLPATTAELAPALANISIPSNLQQILASIQKPEPANNANLIDKSNDSLPNRKVSAITFDEEEYNPEEAFYDIKSTGIDSNIFKPTTTTTSKQGTSRLASLSEAELLKMVPDNIDLADNNSNLRVSSDHPNSPPPSKKSRWDIDPPPPGVEDEYE